MTYTLCILLSMWNFPYGLGLSRISRQFETKRKCRSNFYNFFLIYLYIFLSDLQEFKLMCKNLSQEQVRRRSQTWCMYFYLSMDYAVHWNTLMAIHQPFPHSLKFATDLSSNSLTICFLYGLNHSYQAQVAMIFVSLSESSLCLSVAHPFSYL